MFLVKRVVLITMDIKISLLVCADGKQVAMLQMYS